VAAAVVATAADTQARTRRFPTSRHHCSRIRTMDKGLLFWIVFVVGFIAYGVFNWPFSRGTGAGLIVWVLLFLLGWGVYGFVVR
jgi:hypothetical protein